MASSIGRRAIVVAVALSLSAWLFRSQVAGAIALRGDEWLLRGRPGVALAYYRRAIWVDPLCAVAVDRFAFVATTTHDRATMTEAAAYATRFLDEQPHDTVVRLDRAMAWRALGRAREALEDFVAVARSGGDARAFAFAGVEASDLGERALARSLWRSALRSWPRMPLAAHALAKASSLP